MRPALVGAALTALTLTIAVAACAAGPRVTIVAPGGEQLALVNVEIANTPAERELGLMYRNHLDEDAGMIFVFPTPDRLSFWMKNTEIPLDMIFADSSGKIVGIVQNAEPLTETPRGVGGDSQYVLEVNGGFAQRHHVTPGGMLKFSGFVPQTSQ